MWNQLFNRFSVGGGLLVLTLHACVQAQQPSDDVPALLKQDEASADRQPESTAQLQQLLTSLVVENIPHTYEDMKKWGQTSERWDGLHLSLDGLQLKTKRRKKEVNHGNWKMYRVRLAERDDSLSIELNNVRENGDGRVAFAVAVTAHVAAFGRMSKWVKGVQLFSISADADAAMRMDLQCLLSLKLDASKLPPDVMLAPVVTRADLKLVDFELQRVSDVHGDAAELLGRGIRGVLEDKITEQQPKLTAKLNEQLAKQQDKLRLSISDLLSSRWASLTKYVQKPEHSLEAAGQPSD